MPHVVLNGTARVENIFNRMTPLFIRKGPAILKTMEAYLEREKNVILIESLAIEPGSKTSFLAMISGRPDGVVVRLYPKMDVEKTDGVKQILAEIAKQLMLTFSDLNLGETNLTDYL